ncbi:hypothetical protein JXA80_11605 [bacterium]|nr:hypothetical protein [candidate division CSSED10-310 bacterium]
MGGRIDGITPGIPVTDASSPRDSKQASKFDRFMRGLGTVATAAGKAALKLIPGAEAVDTFFSELGASSMMGQYGGMSPYEMLGLQQQMLQEARVFTVLSNVMKVRHDAAMNAIRNIR